MQRSMRCGSCYARGWHGAIYQPMKHVIVVSRADKATHDIRALLDRVENFVFAR